MNQPLKQWLRISLFNLIIIAFLGTLMRYKIAYAFPFIDQRNLLQGHEYFAFAGWITQALMSLLVHYLVENGDSNAFARYRPLLFTNLFAAYGILLSYIFLGFNSFAVLFSALIIFVSYWFAVMYWRDLNHYTPKNSSRRSFKAAVFFNVISSAGSFLIVYMLITKNIQPNRYLATVYFYLHFQYNGWFFFSCLGLFIHQLIKYGTPDQKLKMIYLLFVSACIPAYFLSALWLPIAHWIYVAVVAAVAVQLIGWWLLIRVLRKETTRIQKHVSPLSKALFVLSAIALTIKLLLQAGSVIPSLSILAFGFRPIVIGYLHLALLGVITLFILSYITGMQLIPVNRVTRTGIVIFTSGIILNELFLMIQGISDLYYRALPFMNPLLFVATLTMLTGITTTVYSQKFPGDDQALILEKADTVKS